MQKNETFSLYTFSFINKLKSSMYISYKYVFFQIFRIKYF